MTSPVVRLYAFAASLLVFFLAWAGIVAHPWSGASTSGASQSAESLAAYQNRLQADAALLQRLSTQSSAPASAPRVRIVTLPPLTTTRTS
jgi:hypothetical protein